MAGQTRGEGTNCIMNGMAITCVLPANCAAVPVARGRDEQQMNQRMISYLCIVKKRE
jgi:hypothetical protein